MLARLSIQNITIIESVEIEFGEGLNIITGETGAGKSIIILSVALILGNRVSDTVLRTGAAAGFIEALFLPPDSLLLNQTLENAGIEPGPELIIKRTFADTGKNRQFVNGSAVSLSFLKELGRQLVDIHGQHDHQALLNPESQLNVLDEYAKTVSLRDLVEESYSSLLESRGELRKLSEVGKERAERVEFLKFQKREIEDANLAGLDEEALKERRKLLKSVEKRSSLAGGAYTLLYRGDGACLEKLASVLASMEEIEGYDIAIKKRTEELRSALFSVEEISRFLREYLDQATYVPEELMEIETRVSDLNALKRKYGNTIDEIIAKKEGIEAEIAAFDSVAAREEALQKKINALEKETERNSVTLAGKREEAACKFKREVERELGELRMGKVVFDIVFSYKASPHSFITYKGKPVSATSKGIGQMEFFFSSNVGEEGRALAKIASGGELSRVMLVLKKVLAEKDKTPVLIFDEIDTGISGGTAEVVGGKIEEVAACHQVFCITHLPQIASRGDTHFLIRKEVADGKTRTVTQKLTEKERVREVARMAGGVDITDTTLQHAQEMISRRGRNCG